MPETGISEAWTNAVQDDDGDVAEQVENKEI